jgi:hypothetical protein
LFFPVYGKTSGLFSDDDFASPLLKDALLRLRMRRRLRIAYFAENAFFRVLNQELT